MYRSCTPIFLVTCLILATAGLPAQRQPAPTQPAQTTKVPVSAPVAVTAINPTPQSAAGPTATNGTTTPTQAAAAFPDPKTPAEFFARAGQYNDLIAGRTPFHMKATFVASGDAEFTGNGTFEEWWQWKDLWRKEATLGGYKYVYLRNGDQFAVFASGPYIPLRLRQATTIAFISIPANRGLESGWKLTRVTEGPISLNAAQRDVPCTAADKEHPLCYLRYEFNDDGILRVRASNRMQFIYNKFQPFNNQLISRSMVLSVGNQPALAMAINTLEPLPTIDKTLFDTSLTPAGLTAQPMMPRDPMLLKRAKVKKPKLEYSPAPLYPFAARIHGDQGFVLVAVSVDEKGKVREPFILQSSGNEFDKAALDAVRQWRYSPLKINGTPRMSTTRIVVNFRP